MKIAATTLDRAIAAVAPRWALRRLAARTAFTALNGGYLGGKRTRRATGSWRPGGGAADADILPDLPELRERSRDAVRNHPIATGALARTATLTVGSGLIPMPRLDRDLLKLSDERADAWERAAAREFELWACGGTADATMVQSFYGLQDLVFRATIESGDCFVLPRYRPRPGSPYGLTLQIYEGDQVSNPSGQRDGSQTAATGNRLAGGVEMDALGAPVAYWVQNQHPGILGMTAAAREWTRVPAFGEDGRRLMRHLYRRLRIGATRGVPDLAPVIEPLKQLTDYSRAELMAAVINSCFAITTKTEGGSAQWLEQSGGTDGKGDKIRITEPGAVFDLLPNEEVSSFTPGRPSAAFDPFFVSVVRQIGAALEIPFEVLIMHFTASYSASRAALEMAWQFIRGRRTWLADIFCQPVYEDVIEEAVALGRLSAPGFFSDPLIRRAWLGCEWIGNGRISVDPMKENEADALAEAKGWKTSEEITAERTGGDWEQKHRQRVKEVRMRREAGLEQAASAPAAAPMPAMPMEDDDAGDDDTEEAA